MAANRWLTSFVHPAPALRLPAEGEWAPSDAFVYTGNLAVDCLPFDTTETVNEEVKQVSRSALQC